MTDESCLLDESKLTERYEDTLFRLAMIRLEKKRAAALEEEAGNGDSGLSAKEIEDRYTRSLPRVIKNMAKEVRLRSLRSFFHSTLPKSVQIAAGVLLALFIAATSALAVSRTARVYLTNFLINIEKEYTELSLRPSENAFVDVPAGWQGEYYPSYIPDGYTIKQVLGGDRMNDVVYVNAVGKDLQFGEYRSGAVGNIDTENAQTSFIQVNGTTAFLSVKGDEVLLAWAYVDQYFLIDLQGKPEEATKIANSIVKIR